MIVRALDSTGDFTFGKGRNDYLSKSDAIIQTISTRLKSFLGDCFFATNAGIDWFNLLGSKQTLELELAVRATVLNTPGVSGITNSEVILDRLTRKISITYTVSTVYSGDAIGTITALTSFLVTESGDMLVTEDDLLLRA